jgi:hypothetical protein
MSDDGQVPYMPTPPGDLEHQICSACVPKNEREWWAHREIERLRAELAAERARAERAEENQSDAERIARVWMETAKKAEADRAAARLNDARYRWLRDNMVSVEFFPTPDAGINIMLAPNDSEMEIVRHFSPDLDAAIDAARCQT